MGNKGQACALLTVAAGGEPSDAAVVWRLPAEDRNAGGASGIGGLHSVPNFGGETGRQRDKCLTTQSENGGVRCFMPTRGRAGQLRRYEKASGLKPRASNFAFGSPWCRYGL